MITGQFPKQQWQLNPHGQTRTIIEALEIAQKFGVQIPDDVEFHVDDTGELDARVTARGPRVDKPTGHRVNLSDLIHDQTRKIPFRVWPGILQSDEAIVAVFGHEMYELAQLRPFLEEGVLSIDDFIHHTEPGRSGNFHDQAWDVADRLVDEMRGASPP